MALPVRLLLVGDALADPGALLQALREGSYAPSYSRVDTAEGLGETRDAGPWDVVLADPGLSGLGAADVIAHLQARDLDIPLIAVSEDCWPERIVVAMRAGARDYLLKGDDARLVVSIERELRDAAGRRAKRELAMAVGLKERILEMIDQAVCVTDMGGDAQ